MKATAIITGGTKGLGREIGLAFGRRGYHVLALFSNDAGAAEDFSKLLSANAIPGGALKHDVCFVDSAVWNRPEIHEADKLVLVNNACPAFSPMPLHQIPWPDFEKQFLVAVKGAWSCSQALIRPMIKNGHGTIVNILTSAIEGPVAPKGFAAYLTAKHALHGFSLALASEYGPRGIRVFGITPGYMETPLTDRWDERLRETIRSNSSRASFPKDVAGKIVDLVEDPALPGRGENYPF